jgi:hypothetical protein
MQIRALGNQRSFHDGDLPTDLRVVAIDRGVRVERYDGDPSNLELHGLTESPEASLELQATTIPYLG